MQEPRRDSVSVNYIWTTGRFDHCFTAASGALVCFFQLAEEVPKLFPNAPKQLPMMLKQSFERRIEPTNETSHSGFSDSQRRLELR